MPLEDKHQRKIDLKKKRLYVLNLDFDLPCINSSRRCFEGSLGGWSIIFFLQNFYINTKGRFNEKSITIDL